MLKGSTAAELTQELKPYEDVTYKNKKNVDNLELWLYEQIEKSL